MSRLEEIIQYEHTTPKGRHYVGFKSEEDFKRLIAQTQKTDELQAKVDELEKQIKRHRKEKYECMKNKQHYKQTLEELREKTKESVWHADIYIIVSEALEESE
ncbi:hypothetical protein [Oceanobacillus kimchii]|uniref:Uncharacterized protein n=1 Tax=Oceanobacillus kimchii TaxID=746691 RepID=A0ABQ5TF44_9BACI|nr:hypothetical protein [Oceanobacillus kimchii]GLO64727.1 hypothetical protein MACH08_05110 [Oceanobacillus kimchii]